MKNLLTAVLPALALFALGGCASSSAVASSEDDGVYYSSKDRTTAIVQQPAPVASSPASTNEAANPDYNGSTAGTTPQSSGSDQYYDNTYTYMRGVPSYGAVAYVPYSPYTSITYAPVAYGWGGGGCGFSPYGYYDPFCSTYAYPYYSPGISITFGYGGYYGYGRPYGYGGGYYGYGRPYGYYGGGFYDPYYYSSPYYGGYYGRGGYYGNRYYGGSAYGGNYNNYGGSGYGDTRNNTRYRTSGHRDDRVTNGRNTAGNVTNSGSPMPAPTGGGRVRTNDVVAAPAGSPTQQTSVMASGDNDRRTRTETVNAAQNSASYNQPQNMDVDRTQTRNLDQLPTRQEVAAPVLSNGQGTRDDSRNTRWRNTETAPQSSQMQPQPEGVAQPQDEPRTRRSIYGQTYSQPSQAPAQTADQPSRQRTYQPQQQQRGYEQPQRTYEQPQRTYEQPQRSNSQPSYSAPSYGGGNSGGGGGHSRGRRD